MTRTPPECARLAAELRLLRARSGLSLSALAVESAYSKSSWQRYLTGRALPPWLAVRALCILANEPEPRLRALWELAESDWSRRGAIATAEPTPVPGPAVPVPSVPVPSVPAPAVPGPGRSPRWRVGVAGGVAVLLLAGLLALTGRAWTSSDPGADAALSAPSAAAFHVGCTGSACDGLDPGAEKCGVEPETLLHTQIPAGFGLEIRYSPKCRAAWARVWNTAVGDTLSFTVPGRPRQSVTVASRSDATGFVYTDLVAVTGRAARLTACLSAGSAHPPKCYSTPSP
ncbi:XRE family transcriptional regulator [Streptomyces sp. GbtcB6]|uniref:helix-turn-helix domain-containing protein n=1 Tax=Streptomyces sp. GbtcB6 TaxID=2824751 RepID=UPI001C2F507F|nr:XRE family transcriptional regulator [Streptomyces sp. GbtcB6]